MMTKIAKIILIVALISLSVLGFAGVLAAQETETDETYIPISPLPLGENNESEIDLSNPEGFLTSLFVIFLSVILILAVIRLIICGLQYMLSESVSNKKGAEKCIWTVVGGIAIILLSILVLTLINPELVELRFFQTIREEPSIRATEEISSEGGGVGKEEWCFTVYNEVGDPDSGTTNGGCFETLEQCKAASEGLDPESGVSSCFSSGGFFVDTDREVLEAQIKICQDEGGWPIVDDFNFVHCRFDLQNLSL